MRQFIFLCVFVLSALVGFSQSAEEVVQQVKAKLDKVNDYHAKAKMKTNVVFIKAPVATVNVYFKKPNKLRIRNEKGISFIPKGSVNVNLGNVFTNTGSYDIIDAGKENGLRIIKLLPRDEDADVVLATLYIDEKTMLVKKSKTTTKENGTYELEMTYGNYAAYGLADKVIFTFNTKEYKLPKGITLDYDNGSSKESNENDLKNRKGKVELTYTSYELNKGIPDSIFQ